MKNQIKKILVAIILVFVVWGSVDATSAYLNGMFGLNNTFESGVVKPAVIEEFDGKVKKNVAVENKGNVPVYVRCRVMIYKELPDGSVSADNPKTGSDYTISYSGTLSEDWILADGLCYYKKPIPAGGKTSNLIDRCELLENGVVVDIAAQAIQAEPARAVSEAWKTVEVDPAGNLKLVSAPVAP